MKINPSKDWFKRDEVDALLAASPSPWWRAFLELSIGSGLRTSELLRLHWSDIDRGTRTVRVTGKPLTIAEDPHGLSLRTGLHAHRERFVPVDARLFGSLDALRQTGRGDSHPFVSERQLGRLWMLIATNEPIDNNMLVPKLNQQFTAVQRLARHALAAEFRSPLSIIRWKPRSLAALRNTYGVRAAALVRPKVLAADMGVARTSEVLRYYDLVTMSGGVT